MADGPAAATGNRSVLLPGEPMTLRSLLLAVLLGLTVLVGSPTGAHAHAGLTSSTPEDGTSVEVLPDEVTLEFSEDVRTPAYVYVTGPDRSTHETGDPQIDGPRVTQALEAPAAQAGDWTIAYRVVSADGHPISGQVRFTVETDGAAPTETPSPGSDTPADDPADGTDDSSAPPIVIAAALAVLLVAVAAVVVRRKRGDR